MSHTALICLILYIVLGLFFCVMQKVLEDRPWMVLVNTLLFWPFVAPFLLGSMIATQEGTSHTQGSRVHRAALSFQHAVDALDSSTHAILSDHLGQVEEAIRYGESMELRCAQLTQMTRSPEFDPKRIHVLERELAGKGYHEHDLVMRSILNRHRNIESLHNMVEDANKEIDRVVLSLEDLATQMALLRVGGAVPQSTLLEGLTDQIQHICAQPLPQPS